MVTTLSDKEYTEWIEELTHQVEKGENLVVAIPQLRMAFESYKKKIDEDFQQYFKIIADLEDAYAKGKKIGYCS